MVLFAVPTFLFANRPVLFANRNLPLKKRTAPFEYRPYKEIMLLYKPLLSSVHGEWLPARQPNEQAARGMVSS